MLPSKKQKVDSVNMFESLESILGNVATNKDVKDAPKKNLGPDLKNIVIPDSLVESIVSFKKPIESQVIEPEVIEESEEDSIVSEQVILEAKITNLVSKLEGLLKEAKSVIQELTSCGMIGTNQKFVLGKKVKNGSAKTDKRNKSKLG